MKYEIVATKDDLATLDDTDMSDKTVCLVGDSEWYLIHRKCAVAQYACDIPCLSGTGHWCPATPETQNIVEKVRCDI